MTIHTNTAARLTTPRRFLLAVAATYLLAWCLPSVRFRVIVSTVVALAVVLVWVRRGAAGAAGVWLHA